MKMKMRKRSFALGLLFVLAVLLGALALSPISASAIEIPELYVGGVKLEVGHHLISGEVTATDGAPDFNGSEGFAYRPDKDLLILCNYEYEGWGYEESQNNFYLVYAEGDLNIILLGESSFKASASVNADFTGIYVNNDSLNINGPGKLTVDASESIRVNAGDLSIEGGRLNLTHRGNTYGIYASGSVSISGGIHSVTGYYGAVYAAGGTSMSGGSLTATGDNHAIDGNFSMTSGCLLAIASGDGASAFNSSKSIVFPALTVAEVFGYDNVEGNSAQFYDDEDKASYKRVLVKPTVHNVWIGGTQLSNANMPIGVFFDPISRTLTLTDFTCNNTSGYAFSGDLKALVYSEDDLNIILSGENTLTAMPGEYGIKLADNRLLTIDTDTKEGETGALTVSGAYGIDAVSEIKGGSITVAGTEAAMNTVPGMSAAPDLRSYYETACIKVSENADGTAWTQDYDAAEIAEYKYIRLAEGARIEYYLNEDLMSSEIREIGEEYQLPTCEYELPFAYEFDGWALGSVDGTTVYDEGDTVTVTENMAFHAVLKQKTATVRVYYPKAGAHAAVEYMLPYGTHTLDFIDAVVTPPEGLELKGFSEWYMGEPVTEIEVDPYGASLYAIWGAEEGVTFYDLYVGGIPVTAQNKGDILGDGTAAYDPATKTLTLTNMSLTAEEALFADEDYSLGSIIALGELNILLVGESSIVAEYGNGISVEDLTISAGDENGALDIDAYEYAISSYELTVESGAYHLVGSSGLDAYLVTVNGGNFDIEAADEEYGAGIYAYRAVINGGVINILFDRSICVSEGGLEINGGEITVTDVGTAIEAGGDVMINGGKLTLHGLNAMSYGIFASDADVIISGEDTVVEIDGFGIGIYLETNESRFGMDGGSLKIIARDFGIFVRENGPYNEPYIKSGTLEISAGEAGGTFAYLHSGTPRPVPYNYIIRGKSDATASTNADGSAAVVYNEDDLGTYKYVSMTVTESYGIIIADGEDNGVMITKNNYADVLGDGTVSYDPKTNTLTLKGYKYEGEGFIYDGWSYGILALPNYMNTLTVLLEGENEITLTETEDVEAICVDGADAVIKGDGSLEVNSPEGGIYVRGDVNVQGGNITVNAFSAVSAYDFKMTGGSVNLNATYAIYTSSFAIAGGALTVTAVGDSAYGVYVQYYFVMNGGNVKIATVDKGIYAGTSSASLEVLGGTLEISTKNAGYAFVRYDSGNHIPILPDAWGEGTVTASVNADGSGAVAFDEAAFETYKYVKATVKLRFGIVIANGEDDGVMIDEDNYTDPLGDGTVSYDPQTNTLTLKGYKYEGEGFEDGGWFYGIFVVPDFMDTLTLLLEGENEITLTGTEYTEAICVEGADVVIKGNGSLEVNSPEGGICLYDASLEIQGGNAVINASCPIMTDGFTMNGGALTLTARGANVCGMMVYGFTMNGGSLNIGTDYVGIAVWLDGALTVCGGTLEISTKTAGYAFARYDAYEDEYLPTLPTVAGDNRMLASVNEDGSGAVALKETALESYKYVSIHVHDYGTDWRTDGSEHWNECACGDKANKAAHSGGSATCTAVAICSVCNAAYGSVTPHTHGSEWKNDANEHWNECSCGDKANKAAHSGGSATCQAKAKCEVCNAEYGELAACAGGTATCTEKAKCATCGKEYGEFAPHNYNITNGYKGSDGHANTCSCGAHDTPVSHTPDRTEATETDPIKCTVCGYIIEPVKGHVHAPKSEWKSDEDNHWHECTGCEGQQLEKAAHIDGNGDNKCDTCDYAMPTHDPDDPGTTPPADNPPTDDDGGLGAGAIAGIVCGSVAVAGIGGFALFWFVIKKKSFAELLMVFKK
ncbi:MAG: carbohydrate-binding domain-containing protein [Clostridia bacterium]|nr:carbohydrate-binding domain-containing protein [Clostridia bacterium]